MSQQPHIWGVVPAAGTGVRMGAAIPKQYLVMHGKTILAHTLNTLCQVQQLERVVVALAPDDTHWSLDGLAMPHKIQVTHGGLTHIESVLNGVLALADVASADDWIVMHDAVRPCVRLQDIQGLLEHIASHAVGGLLGMPVGDTLKRVHGPGSQAGGQVVATVARENLWHALTPQIFRYGVLREALQTARASGLSATDSAGCVEALGLTPCLFPGSPDNIKLTYAGDLAHIEAWFSRQQLPQEFA